MIYGCPFLCGNLNRRQQTIGAWCQEFQKEYGDLEGWTLFEEFMDELDEECTVNVHVDAYVYGEGEEFIATPEEVAYMTIRRQDRPDFSRSPLP